MKKIGSRIGFSEVEVNVLSFVVLSLLVGIVAYYFKYKDEVTSLKQYDYSLQDSLFWNNLTTEQNRNIAKKKVDYEQELYDFSANELESVLTKINVNTASVEELKTLPGIGEKTAKKIIFYRDTHGKFRSVNELINVRGIGEKKLDRIKNYILIE